MTIAVDLLVDAFYLVSLGVAALFFSATQRLTGARWSAGLARIPPAFALILPIAAPLLFAVVVVARETLYPWARPGAFAGEPAFAGKIVYLHPPFVFARVAAVLVVWIGFVVWFRRAARLERVAAVFVPVFALSFTALAYDVLISLDPSWFSTMFAVYVFAGTFVQGIAAVALAAVVLHRRGVLPGVGAAVFHDLGKLLFAFTTFWAYIWVCQYLLIWYGDIPDEVTYYVARTSGPWLPLFLGNFAAGWVIPFAALLSVRAKRSPRVLGAVSLLVLAERWLDVYLLVAPARLPAPSLGVVELALAAASTGLAILVVAVVIRRAS